MRRKKKDQTVSGEEMICLMYYELRKEILHSHISNLKKHMSRGQLTIHKTKEHQSVDYQVGFMYRSRLLKIIFSRLNMYVLKLKIRSPWVPAWASKRNGVFNIYTHIVRFLDTTNIHRLEKDIWKSIIEGMHIRVEHKTITKLIWCL